MFAIRANLRIGIVCIYSYLVFADNSNQLRSFLARRRSIFNSERDRHPCGIYRIVEQCGKSRRFGQLSCLFNETSYGGLRGKQWTMQSQGSLTIFHWSDMPTFHTPPSSTFSPILICLNMNVTYLSIYRIYLSLVQCTLRLANISFLYRWQLRVYMCLIRIISPYMYT